MVIFESPRAIRVEDQICAFVEFPLRTLIVIGLGAVSGGIVWLLLDLWWLAVIIGIAMCWLFYRWAWRGFLNRLRFCIQFHPDHLQVGRGLARYDFPYDSVEKIAVSRVNAIKDGRKLQIVITCRGDDARVYLDDVSLRECLQMLGEKCGDAIYIDSDGKEHLPKNATRPDFTLLALQRHYRRSFLRWTWTFLAAVCCTLSLTAALLEDLQANGGRNWLTHAHGIVIVPGFAITSFYMMMRYRNKSRVLATTIQTNPIQTDTN